MDGKFQAKQSKARMTRESVTLVLLSIVMFSCTINAIATYVVSISLLKCIINPKIGPVDTAPMLP